MNFATVNAPVRQTYFEPRESFDYEYPNGLKLKPGTPLSNEICQKVFDYALMAHTKISERYDSWGKMDNILQAYIPLDDEEVAVQEKDSRKPVSIIFPYTYAIKETLATYAYNALVQDPIFQYQGVSSEDTVGAVLLQKKIQMDCIKSKVALSIYTMINDALAYGIGIGVPGWDVRTGTRYRQRKVSDILTPSPYASRAAENVELESNVLLYEGNKLDTISPYQILPDPNVSCHKLQESEFYGYVEQLSYVNLLAQEQSDKEMFNVRYLRNGQKQSSIFIKKDSVTFGGTETSELVDVIYMYVNLIPKDWKLGSGEYPEKWLFAIAGDNVILRAKPLGLTHNMFPIAVIAPDFDGYDVAPLSRLERLLGLQTTVDWLFNSHIANVRKAINDMLIVDPYMINMKDLQSPAPGKLIRTRKPAWGKGVRDSVHQLMVNDITRANISDSSWIVQWMNHVAGVDEAMMGSLRQGGPERLTGAEFTGTRQSAMTRLNKMTMVMSAMGLQDIAYMFACHTQQLMTQETYVNFVGNLDKELAGDYGLQANQLVTPYDLRIDFDVISRDGSVPAVQSTEVWMRMFDIIMKNPEVNAGFDVARIFKHIVRSMGEKNVDNFVRPVNVQVRPDEEVMQQVAKGNMVPMQ